MRNRATSAPAALALTVLLMAGPFAAGAQAQVASPPPPPAVHAVAATLYDPGAGRFLWSHRPDLELPVASLTKLMTAWLALQAPGSTPVKVGSDVVGIPQTTAGLIPGQTYTLGSLLPLLIVRSANDAAVAIADALGGGMPAFVDRMNAEAAAMGLTDTHYVDPNGLDAPGQHSSARDVAELAGADMASAAFRELASLRTATLPGGATFSDENPFLGAYPGADGVKTGFTSTAGFCLAASATRDGQLLIAVVLGEPSWDKAVADASALLTWGFGQEPAPPSAGMAATPGTAATTAGSSLPTTPALVATAPPTPAATGAAQPAGAGHGYAAAPGPRSTAPGGPPRASPRTVAPPPRHIAPGGTRPRTEPPKPALDAAAGARLAWLAVAAVVLLAVAGAVVRRVGAHRGG